MLETRLDVRALQENAVHVRAFLAKRTVWPYIKLDFQHELARLLEISLDVRLAMRHESLIQQLNGQVQLGSQLHEAPFPARRKLQPDSHVLGDLPSGFHRRIGIVQHRLVYREDAPP